MIPSLGGHTVLPHRARYDQCIYVEYGVSIPNNEAYRLIDFTAGFAIENPAKRAFAMEKVDVLEAIHTGPELGLSEEFLNEHYPR